MKKSIVITALLSAFSLFGYSQELKIENGKAVQVYYEKRIIPKEELLQKSRRLEQDLQRTKLEVLRIEIELIKCDSICIVLGYKK